MLRKLIARQTVRAYTSTTSSTIDSNEIHHFKQFAEDWWNQLGVMKPLHSMNKLRVPFIRDGLINAGAVPKPNIHSPLPLKGISILDVGCGGGILAEPLARIGANVTGLDANGELLEKARTHTKFENLTNCTYEHSSIEDYAEKARDKYDAVVTSETLEHVTNKEGFLRACLKCLKPGGSIFVTTMSKTCLANAVGIGLVENVFRLLPPGTHDYDKFIEPFKLERLLEEQNCKVILVHGMFYNPISNEWTWVSDQSINYALHAVKLGSS